VIDADCIATTTYKAFSPNPPPPTQATHRADNDRREHPKRREHEHRLLPREIARGVRARGPEQEHEVLRVEQEEHDAREDHAEDRGRLDVAVVHVRGVHGGVLDVRAQEAVFEHAVCRGALRVVSVGFALSGEMGGLGGCHLLVRPFQLAW
jgi:hypothetical protein